MTRTICKESWVVGTKIDSNDYNIYCMLKGGKKHATFVAILSIRSFNIIYDPIIKKIIKTLHDTKYNISTI